MKLFTPVCRESVEFNRWKVIHLVRTTVVITVLVLWELSKVLTV